MFSIQKVAGSRSPIPGTGYFFLIEILFLFYLSTLCPTTDDEVGNELEKEKEERNNENKDDDGVDGGDRRR